METDDVMVQWRIDRSEDGQKRLNVMWAWI